jgi:hypothetical protein
MWMMHRSIIRNTRLPCWVDLVSHPNGAPRDQQFSKNPYDFAKKCVYPAEAWRRLLTT